MALLLLAALVAQTMASLLLAALVAQTMASLLLAALVAQTKGIKFYDWQTSVACRGEHVSLVRRPDSVYDVNCLDGRLARSRFIHGHKEAPISACLSPRRCVFQ